MEYRRLYDARGAKIGVLAMPTPGKDGEGAATLYLPNNRLFERFWDKANEPPVVLDTKAEPLL